MSRFHKQTRLRELLSDSTHGDMSHFGLATVCVLTDNGVAGIGYSYVVGDIGGGALHAMLAQDLAPVLPGRDSDDRERTWHELWWRVHFVSRGGLASFALAAVDIALWDAAAKQASKPWWKLLGGWRKPVPAYAGGIDLQFPWTSSCTRPTAFGMRGSGRSK